MKITLLTVENFKRIKKITIAPGERSMILVAGNNRQGKSSLLGAITAALGGGNQIPEEPVRRGAKKARVLVELDGGKLVVERKFRRSGSTSLEVRSADGKLSSPQKILDELVGARFLDPLKFARLPEKKQREMLLGCVDLGIDLDEHATLRKRAYDARTEANRDVKRLDAEVELSPDPGEIPGEVLTDELLADLDALMAKDTARIDAKHKLAEIRSETQRRQESIGAAKEVAKHAAAHLEGMAERHRAEIADLRDRHAKEAEALNEGVASADAGADARTQEYDDYVATAKAQVVELGATGGQDFTAEITAAKTAIKEAAAKNAERTRLLGLKAQNESAALRLAKAEESADKFDIEIEQLDAKKAAALAAASMPIAGLDIDEDQVLYQDVPLSQASGAEQLQVSLAIAAALSPELNDIWMTDGALCDQNSLRLIQEFAEANGLRVWLERVGESDDNAIIIEEGAIKEMPAVRAAS